MIAEKEGELGAPVESKNSDPIIAKKSKAYLQDYWSLPVSVRDGLRDFLRADCSDQNRTLVNHLLKCAVYKISRREYDWIPLPSSLLKEKIRGYSVDAMVAAGALEPASTYSKEFGRCSEYWPGEKYLRLYFRLMAAAGPHELKVNIFDDKPTEARVKSRYRDDQGNPEPALIVAALRAYSPAIIDYDAFTKRVARLKLEAEQSISKDGKITPESYRYYAEMSCYLSLQDQGLVARPDGLCNVRLAYTVCSTGRKNACGGGMQSCTRGAKALVYGHIPGIRNYDLKSCHPSLLRDLLILAGLETTWVDDYLKDPRAKYTYSERVGISPDVWKKCLNALMYGSPAESDKSAVFKAIYDSLESIKDDSARLLETKRLHARFLSVAAGLMQILKDLRKFLIGHCLKRHKGREYAKNASNKIFYYDSCSGHELGKKLLAFIMQGSEQRYIDELTLIATAAGVQVFANEHDGLIARGVITQDMADRAADLSGIHSLKLEQKPFEFDTADSIVLVAHAT